eukprot:m.198129 g.198129  ORF g.198129 m.198129 type:complete len:53 (-) comp14914_c0_seq3:139-297(-)
MQPTQEERNAGKTKRTVINQGTCVGVCAIGKEMKFTVTWTLPALDECCIEHA